MSARGEVLVLPAFGQGHLFPCMELCRLIASRNYKTTLVIFSSLSSSVPVSFREHSQVDVLEVPPPPQKTCSGGRDEIPLSIPMHPDSQKQLCSCIETLLTSREADPDAGPIVGIADVLEVMGSVAGVFKKFQVPIVGLFTSGACSAAMEYAAWQFQTALQDLNGDSDAVLLPGLPEEMGITWADLQRRRQGPPRHRLEAGPQPGHKRRGPGRPGDRPLWMDDASGSLGLMINTCDDLERPFVDYLSREVGKPVWGVGPLFPEQYWNTLGTLVRDSQVRTNRTASVTEDGVIQWLNGKHRGSVLYVAFGSSVDLTREEYPQLADALQESTRSFIWVLRADAGRAGPPREQPVDPCMNEEEEEYYYPHELAREVGARGLIIRGWAPQLLILSHPSTGGFLSHCGWNSTTEAIGRGVPFLAWPLRGDQYYNAKLVSRHLKVGHVISANFSETVKKEEIGKGIEMLMGANHEETKRRAEALARMFEHGIPSSSSLTLDAFCDFIVEHKK